MSMDDGPSQTDGHPAGLSAVSQQYKVELEPNAPFRNTLTLYVRLTPSPAASNESRADTTRSSAR